MLLAFVPTATAEAFVAFEFAPTETDCFPEEIVLVTEVPSPFPAPMAKDSKPVA